ncbi:MAG: hypothetical protein ACYTGW_13175 [Planctomycetota bacterium]|jgi:hypothetical protein
MKHVISTFTVLAALTLSGCAAEAGGSSGPQINHAICRILGTVGNEKVKGVVYFIQEGANVRIKAEAPT